MAALLFNTCCCCIDLRTASLVIGYLQLTACILVEILSMIMLAIDYKFEYYPIGKLDPKVTLVVLLLVIILDMGVIIMMIIGVHKNKRGYVKGYLVYKALNLVLCIISFFVLLSINKGVIDITSLGFLLTLCVATIYFVLVIRSYYYKMQP